MNTDFASLMPRTDEDSARVQRLLIGKRRSIDPDVLVVCASILSGIACFVILAVWG